jgi:hypothetical protein
MKNLLLLISLGVLVASCGKEKPLAEETTRSIRESLKSDYAEMIISVNDADEYSMSPSVIKISEPEGTSALQVVVLVNLSATSKTFTLDSLGLSSRYTVTPVNCTLPVTLRKKENCFLSVNLTAPQVAGDVDSENFNDSFTINGETVAIQTEVMNVKTASEVFSSNQLYMSRTSINQNLAQGDSFSNILLLKNLYKFDLENFQITTANEINQGGIFTINNNCPSTMKIQNNCLLTVSFDSTDASENSTASIDIILAQGVVIPVTVSLSDNPENLNYLRVQELVANSNTVYTIYNDSREISNNLSFNIGSDFSLDFPSAVKLVNNCPTTMSPSSSCAFSFSTDKRLFHNGVMFSKELMLNGSPFTFSFMGTSPCVAGMKYNKLTQLCEPNLGVFDSADSLFGYAVFQ